MNIKAVIEKIPRGMMVVPLVLGAMINTFAPQALVYKKIDSTFRGNVGAEIEAAIVASGGQLAIVAAAIPAAGWVTLKGECRVHGLPLAETEFASDPKTPIVSSHIKTLIGLQTAYPIHELGLQVVRSDLLVTQLPGQLCLA